jgi:hypothetical protein
MPRGLLVLTASLFLVGAALRLWFVIAAPPAFIGYPDSRSYMLATATRLFSGVFQPAGYPLFLRGMRAIDRHLSFAIAVQHLLGLVTAGLYFAAVRRVAQRRWVALIPATFVLFDGMELFFEHSVMSETLLVALLGAAIYSGIRALDGRWPAWTVAMGCCIGLAVTVRAVALPLVPMVVVWLLFVRPVNSPRLLPPLAAATAALGIVALYAVANNSQTGVWGLTQADAFNPYTRVASFANCSRWRPPRGTGILCARRAPPPALDKPGPFLWACSGAPGLCRLGDPPDADARMRRFALAAVMHQPGDYLAAVGRDLMRFAAPPRRASQSDLLMLLDDPGYAAFSVPVMRAYYDERSLSRSGSVDAYAHGVHTTGPVIALLVLSALAGVVFCRDSERIGVLLFASVGLIMLLSSVATATYQPRYALPAIAPLAGAAALATSALVARLSRRRQNA